MRFVFFLSLTALFGGCLYADYDEVADNAPIGLLEAGSYVLPAGFGRVLHAYRAEGPARSRIAASAGTASPHVIFDVWTGPAQGRENAIFDGCDGNCEEGSGSALASIGTWQRRDACVLIGSQVQRDSTQDGRLRIQCEGPTNDSVSLALGLPGEALGAALAPLGALGAAVVGAPLADSGRGALYILPTDGQTLEALTLPQLDLAANAGLGSELATFDVPAADGLPAATIILAAAPGMERVVALRVRVDADGGRVAEAIACMDGVDIRLPSDLVEEGGGIALVDTDGDGQPEALLGDPRADRVLLVPLDGLVDGAGCADAAPEMHPGTLEISCGNLPVDGRVVCDGLGSSVSGGDFDGDGDVDLIFGAALSSVAGATNAGALYVLPNSSGFDASAARVLSVSSATANAELGTRVVVTQSQLTTTPRDEPVASAPGTNKLYIFYCTGLAGDAASEGQRCLGTSP
ncbi:MAG: hypothetical protein ACI9KE_000724 [Polyangiales bacterium]|jgi:hypothetical protein